MNKDLNILTAAYLSEELTPQDKDEFEKKLANDSHLDQEVKLLVQFWNKMDDKKFDADAAWDNLSQRIDNEKPLKRRKIGKTLLIGIAAASILVFGILTVIIADFLPGNNQQVFLADQKMEVILPDESKVVLKKGSKLTLDEHFNHNTRTVNLKGEGWFEVQPNKEIPFIIEAARCEIRVVGTKFSVDSRPNLADKVVVKSGEVLVTHKFSEKSVSLKATDNVAITRNSFNKNVQIPDNYLSWVLREFYFSNTALKDVCNDLNQAFKKQIQLKGVNTQRLKLSATFRDQSIEEIAKIIAKTHNLEISSSQNQIILSKRKN